MSSVGGRHEWLMSEVVQNIATVEHVLGQLEKSKQQLVDNARQVREEIKSFVQDQVDGIHSREIQLLRQVDVLTNHQMSMLNVQRAHLHQTIGSLKSSLQSLQRCKSDMAAEKIYVEDVKCCKQISAPPKMHLSLNSAAVEEAIQGFGCVQVDGMLNMTDSTTSKCLPSKIEEYMDGDHHLLYKPLYMMPGENDANVVKVCFPKLPSSKRQWLAKPSSEENNIKEEAEHTSLFKLPDTYRSSQIEHWLGQIKRETAVEPVGGEMEDFDFVSPKHLSRSHLEGVDQSHSSCASSIPSESIEMVSHISDTDMGRLEDEEKVICCCNESSSTIEIENLDSIPCFSDKDHWLAKEKTHVKVPSSEIETPPIMIEKVCKANETCSSFKECLCEMNCEIVAKESWLDKQQQGKQKWLSSLEIRDDKAHLQEKKLPLLFPFQDKELSYWLPKKHTATVDYSMSYSTRIPYPPSTCTWIHSSPISSPISGKGTFPLPSIFSASTSTWLRSRACKKESENSGKKNRQQGSILPDSFKLEWCTWLKPEKSESAQFDKVHACKRISLPALFNSEPSIWLKHAEKPQDKRMVNSSMEIDVASSLTCSSLFPQWLLQPMKNVESKPQVNQAKESPGQMLGHDAIVNHCSSPWLKSGLGLSEKGMECRYREVEKHDLDSEIAGQIKWLASIRKNPLTQLKVKTQCKLTGDDSPDLTKWLLQKC